VDYNRELMDPIEPYSRTAMNMLVLLGVMMDLFSLKWTYIANYFLYHECLVRMTTIMIPDDYGSHLDMLNVMMRFLVNYSAFYCDTSYSLPIFANTLASAYDMYFARCAYNSEFTVLTNILDIGLVCILFLGQCLFTMFIIYQQHMHAVLARANQQNNQILNGMHEGLLILKKPAEKTADTSEFQEKFMLCNKTVAKMINTFIVSDSQDKGKEISESEVLTYAAF